MIGRNIHSCIRTRGSTQPCKTIHHSKALDELFPVIKSALLDSLIQSKYGQKTVGAFSASDTVHVRLFAYFFYLHSLTHWPHSLTHSLNWCDIKRIIAPLAVGASEPDQDHSPLVHHSPSKPHAVISQAFSCFALSHGAASAEGRKEAGGAEESCRSSQYSRQ